MRAVNLLPADLRGAVKAPAPVGPTAQERGSGTGALVVLGALALCVLGLAGYVLTGNQIRQRQADLDQLTARSAAVTREVAALKPYADFQSTAQARIATVRDLVGQRFDWEHALRDLATALPADVTVTKLSASVSSDAGAESPLRGAIPAPAVTIDGCTRDQRSVARMMSRLRDVSGVTRVSLAKSDKPDVTQSASVDSAAPATGVAGCSGRGKDAAPVFQVVAFFEGDAAASAAAAPATPGAPTPKDAASASGAKPAATPQPAAGAQGDGATPVSNSKGAE